MKLSGSYQIKLEKQKVWEALNDPEILQKAIPGCESFTKNSDTEFTATATNKIGPFKDKVQSPSESNVNPVPSIVTSDINMIFSQFKALSGELKVEPLYKTPFFFK